MNNINKEELDNITSYLKHYVFKNPFVMHAADHVIYADATIEEEERADLYYDLIDMIASLHNLLCEAVEGSRYNYMDHWAREIGSACNDEFFDDIMKENQEGVNDAETQDS